MLFLRVIKSQCFLNMSWALVKELPRAQGNGGFDIQRRADFEKFGSLAGFIGSFGTAFLTPLKFIGLDRLEEALCFRFFSLSLG